MDSLTELVDVVIGVDTHVSTHTAAVVNAGTGGAMAELTVEATAAGYAEPVAFADEHSGLRAWAIEGTGIHGAGLTRHLEQAGEVVIELDRPERAQRRSGAKSDPLDAVRAAREALSHPRLGTPRSSSAGKCYPCCWPPDVPRSPTSSTTTWTSSPCDSTTGWLAHVWATCGQMASLRND